MTIFTNVMGEFSGVDLTTWLLGGALVGALIGRGMGGGHSWLVGDVAAGVLGALAAIGLVSTVTNLAHYGFGGRLAVAMVGGAIFAASARGAQYHWARRGPPPGSPVADASAKEAEPEVAPTDETSRTPTTA